MSDLARRLAAQRISEPAGSVEEVVRSACGLQAQDEPAARLAVRARSQGLVAGDVSRALDRGAIVRTWAMRGTLHLLAREDAAWIVPLLGPVFEARFRRRMTELGLDEAMLARGRAALAEALDGPVPRRSLIERLREAGVALEGQARPHLLAHAARAGDLVFAANDVAVPFHPEPLDRAEALRRLARRYLEGFGPAEAGDFALWSGLQAADVRVAWDGVAAGERARASPIPGAPVVDGGAPGERTVPEPPVARLLGAFDNVLLGWRDRSFLLPPAFAKRIQNGGRIEPVVLVRGRAAAKWRVVRKKRIEVAIEPFEALPRDVEPAIEAEIADVRRFLGG